MRAMQFVGAGNYRRLLGDPEFWASLRAGAIWVAGSVIPQFLLGLAMALVLNERFRGRGLVRTIVLVPWVVSGVVTGIIWTWLFDGTVGVVNDLLVRAGLIGAPVAWTVQPATTWLALFVANAWRGAPFFAIVLLAALQSISPDLYEAAKIDGAGPWQRFRYITLPALAPMIKLSVFFSVLGSLHFFDMIVSLTGGGPLNSSHTIVSFLYYFGIGRMRIGFGSAVGVFLFILCATVAFGYKRLFMRDHDD
jgi:ABC-type sugar transport system permease subunit